MTELSRLLADCDNAGIHLTALSSSELKVDAPSKALTPELVERLKSQKFELLRILNAQPDDWPETIDVRDVQPCETCGSIELWETSAGKWRCLRCDPPTRWRQFAYKYGFSYDT